MEETGIYFIALVITLLLSWAIAEFFGSAKHIGFGWTFALSASTMFIGGIIALIASPSAKEEPTSGGKNYQIGAWVCFVFGVGNLIMLNPLALGFLILGTYLYKLSNGEIVNDNPKFYLGTLENLNTNRSERSNAFNYRDSSSGINKNGNIASLKQKREYLQNLYDKGLLDHKEFIDKTTKLKEDELEETVKRSSEFQQLKALLSSGVLTKDEFDQKTEKLKLRMRQYQFSIHQDSVNNNYTNDASDSKQWTVFAVLCTIAALVAMVVYSTGAFN